MLTPFFSDHNLNMNVTSQGFVIPGLFPTPSRLLSPHSRIRDMIDLVTLIKG